MYTVDTTLERAKAELRTESLGALQKHMQDVWEFRKTTDPALGAAASHASTWRIKAISLSNSALTMINAIENDAKCKVVLARAGRPCEWVHRIACDMADYAAQNDTQEMFFKAMARLHRAVAAVIEERMS